jgi:hypothetical protein
VWTLAERDREEEEKREIATYSGWLKEWWIGWLSAWLPSAAAAAYGGGESSSSVLNDDDLVLYSFENIESINQASKQASNGKDPD